MASKAKLTTRSASSTSVTSDNLGKGSELTFNEMDSNLINLRDQTIGIVADDSATINIAAGDNLYIQGGTNVTTATNSDGSVTINASTTTSSFGDLTATGSTISSPSNADLTLTTSGTGDVIVSPDSFLVKLGGSDFMSVAPASGTGQGLLLLQATAATAALKMYQTQGTVGSPATTTTGAALSEIITHAYHSSNIEVAKILTTNVSSNARDAKMEFQTRNKDSDALVTALLIDESQNVTVKGAIKISDDGIETIRSNENLVLECAGTGTIQLATSTNVIGDITVTGTISTDGVSIVDNEITASRSNDNLNITANGSGLVQLGAGTDGSSAGAHNVGNLLIHEVSSSGGTRHYANGRTLNADLTGDTSSGLTRFRIQDTITLDMAGKDSTSAGTTRGAQMQHLVELKNSSSDASVLAASSGQGTGLYIRSGGSGNLTVNDFYSIRSFGLADSTMAGTTVVTDYYHFFSDAFNTGSSGNVSVTNEYGFYVNALNGTNKYAFYDATNGQNLFGDILIKQNTIATNSSNADLEISTSGTGKVITKAIQVGVGDQTGGNIILTDQADGSFQTAQFANPGMLNPSGLQIDSAGSFHYSQLILNSFSTNAYNSLWATRSNTNTHGANAYLDSGDTIFNFFAAGWNGDTDGSGYFSANAQVDMFASEAHDASNRGGGVNIRTINTGASSGATIKFEMTDNVVIKNPKAATTAALAVEGSIRLKNTSDPSNITDSAHIYAKDDGSTSEVYVRDEAGNETKISPHNQSGQWEYFSRNINTGKVFRVNMEKMIRKLEEFTGESFIEQE